MKTYSLLAVILFTVVASSTTFYLPASLPSPPSNPIDSDKHSIETRDSNRDRLDGYTEIKKRLNPLEDRDHDKTLDSKDLDPIHDPYLVVNITY